MNRDGNLLSDLVKTCMRTSAANISEVKGSRLTISILIVGGLFFIMGFISWMNSILIPYFRIACELSNFASYLVAFAFYISYFVMSVPAGYLLKKMGFRKGMMVGFFIMAAGAFIFVPAAMMRSYETFLLGLFSLGAGLAIIQTAANPYITILGPIERAAQRFSIMGIFNKGAGILAPIVFASVILKATDNELFRQIPLMSPDEREVALTELIRRVIVPYICLGVLLLGCAIFMRFSPLPEIDTEHESPELAESNSSKTNIFHFPHLILGAIGIFVHVGAQVIAIDTVISYANSMDVQLLEAKAFPSYTLAAQVCGYLLGIAMIPRFIKQVNALRFCTILGAVLTLLIVYAHGDVTIFGHKTDVSIWFVVLLGFANSLIWAGIWPLALEGLGKFTKIGASLMIMGLCGNAIMPLVYGYFADVYDLRTAYWVLFPCYVYLVFYAGYGHKIRRWSLAAPLKKMATIKSNQAT
jgi:MFS transporter, FHS family, L-fucose permease